VLHCTVSPEGNCRTESPEGGCSIECPQDRFGTESPEGGCGTGSISGTRLKMNVLKSAVRFSSETLWGYLFLTESSVGLKLKSEGLMLLEGWNLLIEL
jgi:hypothetical protein